MMPPLPRSSRAALAAAALVAVLSLAPAAAADTHAADAAPALAATTLPPGARPGDETLTCDEIYAEVAALSQRAAMERQRRNDAMRAQGNATAALVTGAMLTGGLGGTGIAAQAAAEAQADRQMAMLTPPPEDPRKARLRALWTARHCTRP